MNYKLPTTWWTPDFWTINSNYLLSNGVQGVPEKTSPGENSQVIDGADGLKWENRAVVLFYSPKKGEEKMTQLRFLSKKNRVFFG